MNGGAFKRLVNQRKARAELIGIDVLIELIEPEAGIEHELVGQLPFVLDVSADIPAELGAVVVNDKRWSRHGADVSRQDRVNVVDIGLFAAHREAKSQSVAVVDEVGRVGLDAVEHALPSHVRGNIVEFEVADDVGNEVN